MDSNKNMRLITSELLNLFNKTGSQEENKDPMVIAKFFNPTGGQIWLATEYNPEERIFYGYVSLFNDYNNEWGTFSLDELESYKGCLGLGIERDRYFTPKPISKVKKDKNIY